jgi:hypothetical protein
MFDLSQVPDEVLFREAGLRAVSKRQRVYKKDNFCPFCAQTFGSRELRKHLVVCERKPKKRLAKRKTMP